MIDRVGTEDTEFLMKSSVTSAPFALKDRDGRDFLDNAVSGGL